MLISAALTICSGAIAQEFKFVWASDTHFGIPDKYTCGEPEVNFVHFASLSPDFILLTGDITENASMVQTMKMVKLRNTFKHIPMWILPGNHDACPECGDNGGCLTEADCSESYLNYKNKISPELHFIHDVGNLRFIGFDSRLIRTEPYLGFGKIENSELSWVISAIADSATLGRKTIICTHFPVLDVFGNNIRFGQSELMTAMSNAGNVILYLSGHRHRWGDRAVNGTTTHVNGPGLSYSAFIDDPPYSMLGGFFVVTVVGNQINFEMFAADDPAYTPRPEINFSVNY